jgi:hypothetical protein
MELKCLFDSDAVLLDENNPKEALNSKEFNFLDKKILWKSNNLGVHVELGIQIQKDSELKALEIVKKFAALLVYRNKHICKFDLVNHCYFSSSGNVGHAGCQAGVESRFILTGKEKRIKNKTWSMLSFLLEAKNSSSIYYKFICLFKIIEIEKLKKNNNGILIEDRLAVVSHINNQLPKVATEEELKFFTDKASHSKMKKKSVGDYFDHLLRDAFSHTGFLDRNNYKYGYPTLDPLNSSDLLKYSKATYMLSDIVDNILGTRIQ